MFVSTLSGALPETWREFCVFTWTTQFVVDRVLCFSKALLILRHRFPFRKWQVGEGMFCGSKYVQNKVTKEIIITQTEFAAKIVKIPMSAARREDERRSC